MSPDSGTGRGREIAGRGSASRDLVVLAVGGLADRAHQRSRPAGRAERPVIQLLSDHRVNDITAAREGGKGEIE